MHFSGGVGTITQGVWASPPACVCVCVCMCDLCNSTRRAESLFTHKPPVSRWTDRQTGSGGWGLPASSPSPVAPPTPAGFKDVCHAAAAAAATTSLRSSQSRHGTDPRGRGAPPPLPPPSLLLPFPSSPLSPLTASRRRRNKVEFQVGWLNSLTSPPLQVDWPESAASPPASPPAPLSWTWKDVFFCCRSQHHGLMTNFAENIFPDTSHCIRLTSALTSVEKDP